MRLTFVLISTIPFIAGAFYHHYSLEGLNGLAYSWVCKTDTRYSADYTDAGFRKVAIGDSKEKVRLLIGSPLKDGGDHWQYSVSPTDSHYHHRIVFFDSGERVLRKKSEFYLD